MTLTGDTTGGLAGAWYGLGFLTALVSTLVMVCSVFPKSFHLSWKEAREAAQRKTREERAAETGTLTRQGKGEKAAKAFKMYQTSVEQQEESKGLLAVSVQKGGGVKMTAGQITAVHVVFLFFFVPPVVFLATSECVPKDSGFTTAVIVLLAVVGSIVWLRGIVKDSLMRMRHKYDVWAHMLAQIIVGSCMGMIGGSLLLYAYVGNSNTGLTLLSAGGIVLAVCWLFSMYGVAYHRYHDPFTLEKEADEKRTLCCGLMRLPNAYDWGILFDYLVLGTLLALVIVFYAYEVDVILEMPLRNETSCLM